MMEYRDHKYVWDRPYGAVHHTWSVRSVHGAIQFWVSIREDSPLPLTAGLESHSVYPAGEDAPDHLNCPLTGGRCWHEGTSMYAVDNLWPLIEPYLKAGDHPSIFRILEHEAERLAERKAAQ